MRYGEMIDTLQSGGSGFANGLFNSVACKWNIFVVTRAFFLWDLCLKLRAFLKRFFATDVITKTQNLVILLAS